MKKSNRKSNKLWVDEGKEFYNEHMYKLFKFKKEDIFEETRTENTKIKSIVLNASKKDLIKL